MSRFALLRLTARDNVSCVVRFTAMQSFPTPFWEYTLTGFGDSLEQRRVAFTQPFPSSRICSVCSRLPSISELLPCGHVSCHRCRDELFETMKCPLDGTSFKEGDLVRLRLELSELEKRRVLCVVGGVQCPSFAGDLSELMFHLPHCISAGVRCDKCYGSVARGSAWAAHHCRLCCERNGSFRAATPMEAIADQIRSIREDLDTITRQALDEPHVDGNLVDDFKGIVQILARIDRALSKRRETVGQGE